MTPIRFLLVALLACATVSSQAADERKALAAFKHDFTSSPRSPRTPAEREAAIAQLGELDSKKVAESLVDAFEQVETDLAAVVAEREAIVAEMAELVRGQENAKTRTLPQAQLTRFNELRGIDEGKRGELDRLIELRVAVRTRIASLKSEDALQWLIRDVLDDKKLPIALKLEIARAAGKLNEVSVIELMDALPKAKESDQILAIVDGLALAGENAREAAPAIIALLEHKDPAVRERAALALGQIPSANAIEPMIGLLARSTGQEKKRIAASLERLTGQQFGTMVPTWQRWWSTESAAWLAGEHELGKGQPSNRDESKNYYFGLPQDGQSMCYIIDASGSMEKAITMPGKDGPVESSRLEACKRELIDALGRLPKEAKFDIVWYSDLVQVWQDSAQPASPANIAAAQAWVGALQPAGSTNIHDALQTAFGLTGRGARDKHYGIEFDMIFMLTDGSPTKPDGQQDSTEAILAAAREWNALQRVTIHTIGIGGELNESFLRQLARENGGRFEKR